MQGDQPYILTNPAAAGRTMVMGRYIEKGHWVAQGQQPDLRCLTTRSDTAKRARLLSVLAARDTSCLLWTVLILGIALA